MKKKISEVKKGDKVKLVMPNGEKVVLTVKDVDLIDQTLTFDETNLDYHCQSIEVINEI